MSEAVTEFAQLVFKRHFPANQAVCLTRDRGGKTQYRIATSHPRTEGGVPPGGYLSAWCSTEANAWNAAVNRLSNRVHDREHW